MQDYVNHNRAGRLVQSMPFEDPLPRAGALLSPCRPAGSGDRMADGGGTVGARVVPGPVRCPLNCCVEILGTDLDQLIGSDVMLMHLIGW